MENVKMKKIDQQMNAMCQMQTLEKTSTLYFMAPLMHLHAMGVPFHYGCEYLEG
jgi:hypothetical protein